MEARDRIIGLRRVKAGELIDHTANWRRHPKAQRDALEAILESVGYVGALIARETDAGLELIDGHLRKETTPGQAVPVLVVDIDETEARQVLATYDPIGQMADIDESGSGSFAGRGALRSRMEVDPASERASWITLKVGRSISWAGLGARSAISWPVPRALSHSLRKCVHTRCVAEQAWPVAHISGHRRGDSREPRFPSLAVDGAHLPCP